ncbi:hypothetical protein L3V82_01310 [Thiotrichales bacterium 19S3-7]|nr:hypothetical protein [Thiotrichales bacterium 19S3-7]MCF6800800.1 hypothetical protein [Thiotrichales bacterium 19S3-11]
MKKQLIAKSLLGLGLMAGLSTAALADTTAYSTGNFANWAGQLLLVFQQFQTFIMYAAIVIGLVLIFSGLMSYRKYHTSQGAQGEHIKNGSGHIIIGVLLTGIVAVVQMVQGTVLTGAGTDTNAFSVDTSTLTQASTS